MKGVGRSVAALATLAALVAVTLLGVRIFSHWFSHIKSGDRPATISAIGLIVVAIVTYLVNRNADRRRVVEEETRRHKIELYEEMITFLMSMVISVPNVNQPGVAEIQEFLAKSTPQLLTFGSNKVVKLWGKFVRGVDALNTQGPWAFMTALEGLIKAMRKDVGHTSLTLVDGDLARLFLTDVDEVIAQRKLAKKRGAED